MIRGRSSPLSSIHGFVFFKFLFFRWSGNLLRLSWINKGRKGSLEHSFFRSDRERSVTMEKMVGSIFQRILSLLEII